MRRAVTAALLGAWMGCAGVPADGGRDVALSRVRDGLAGPAVAAPDGPLDWDSVALRALDGPRARAHLAELGLARADVLAAGAVPPLRAEADVLLSSEPEPDVELLFRQSLTGLVFAGGRAAAARAALRAEQARAAEAVLAVVATARTALIRWQAASERAALYGTMLAAADAGYEAARALHASGNGTTLALLREQDRLEKAKLLLHRAQLEEAAARERVGAAIGVADGAWSASATLGAPTAPPPVEVCEREAVEHSLRLEQRRHQLAAATSARGTAAWEGWLPDVEVGVAARREHDHGWAAGPSVEIALPLFDQGQAQIGRHDAEAARAAELTLAEAVELRAATREAAERVAALSEELAHHTAVIAPLGQRMVAEALLHVNAMDASVFDLVAARRAVVEAELSRVSALEAYWLAQVSLAHLRAGGAPMGETAAVQGDAGAAREAHGGHR